jgi:hypothetical protein
MNYTDRVKKLDKAIDDMYSNLHLIGHLQHSQKDKLAKLYQELTFHLTREGVIERP